MLGGREENEELLFNGYRISVWKDEKMNIGKHWQNQLSVLSTFTFVLFDNTVVVIADKQ